MTQKSIVLEDLRKNKSRTWRDLQDRVYYTTFSYPAQATLRRVVQELRTEGYKVIVRNATVTLTNPGR